MRFSSKANDRYFVVAGETADIKARLVAAMADKGFSLVGEAHGAMNFSRLGRTLGGNLVAGGAQIAGQFNIAGESALPLTLLVSLAEGGSTAIVIAKGGDLGSKQKAALAIHKGCEVLKWARKPPRSYRMDA